MKVGYLLVALAICSMRAQAEIYKAIDADGHVTYSSTPIKGGKKIVLEPLPTSVPPQMRSRATASPEGFPRVDGVTQRSRDDARHKILLDELSSEENLLEEARTNLKEGEDTPEVYKGKDGKTYRNVAKYEEKRQALKEQVELHQQNVEALKTELSKF